MAIGGGFKAIRSVLNYTRQIGPLNLWQTIRSKNACKACAFGTGGQNGGVFNEANNGIEICNKNIQAHLSDIRPSISSTVFLEKSISDLSLLSGKQLEALGRLTIPLYKAQGAKNYSPIDYDQALKMIAERFKECSPQQSFFYASGRSSNEAAFLLQLLARLYGTNNVNNCSYYCHQASGVALTETLGTGTATIEYTDIEKADCIFVFGANPASNHPRFVKTLIKVRRRGGKVIVVNPAKEPGMVRFASPSDLRSMLAGGASIASEYVQPHLGGDIAFIHGVAKYLLEHKHENNVFIDQHTQNFSAFKEGVINLSWGDIEANSGVTRIQIERVAKQYAQSKNAIFCWSMGLTHHLHGVENIQSLVSLALLRGMIGRPGAGLLPLRGHSNIQGTGSMGFTPALKQAIKEKLEAKLGTQLPKDKGMDTMSCMEASNKGDIKVAFMLGGNLLASNPDTQFATQALNNIPFKCYLNSTLNMSHVHGVDEEVIILPVRVRDEENQATTQESMFNYVRLSDGGIHRFPQLRSEVELITQLGMHLIPQDRFDFSLMESHDKIREYIGDAIPGFDKIYNINRSKEEFHIEGRILHSPVFNTPSKKAVFSFTSSPVRKDNEFLLTSVRSEGQFNSIIYHEYDSYRDQKERWVVMMNPEDMEEQGLQESQAVDIQTDTGTMKAVKVKPFDIRKGNVMAYYPEANVLIPRNVDNKSYTPGFKSVKVTIISRE